MNQPAILELYAGGPGSGCHGESCGRPKSGLQKMLDQVKGVWHENNVWVKLAKYGHPGNVAPFSVEELKVLNKFRAGEKCEVGFCFMNAQRIGASAQFDNKVRYVEGLVTVHGVPIDHAWIEYNEKVYDPTLAKYKADEEPDYTRAGKMSSAPTPEYVGVDVPKGEILRHWHKKEVYSPLSHEHRNESLQKKIWK